MERVGPAALDCGVASVALILEEGSGDGHLVRPTRSGALVAVVDGLGHGREAAAATAIALEVLDAYADRPLPWIVLRCHERLRESRGVTLAAGTIDAGRQTLTWLGVGNVAAVLWRADPALSPRCVPLIPHPGLVGRQFTLPLTAATLPMERNDALVLATDGVSQAFADRHLRVDAPERTAQEILHRYRTGTDDALAVVARYLGGAAL